MHKLKDDIKVDLKETGYEVGNWIQLAQNRIQWSAIVNMIKNQLIP
jgi:hypothetical protein